MKLHVRRAAALVAAPALAAATLVATAGAPAQAAPTTPATPEATAAATWLLSQTTAGTLPSVGQSIDYGVGLVATGASPQALAAVKAGIDNRVASYATGNNSTAKSAWFYALAGNPRAAGTTSLDLLGAVETNTDDATGALGGDFPQQWFGALALVEGGSPEAAASVDYLQSGQCADGGWGFDIPCVGDGDPFATFYSLAALAAVDAPDAGIRNDIAEAVAFLTGKQSASGGFENCTEYAGPPNFECLKREDNANDTGLAAWSLGLAGATGPATKAAEWIARHQFVSLPACGLTPADAGAVSWTDTTFAQGVTEQNRAQTVFASAQALGGLAYLPASTPTVKTSTSYVDAGSTVPVTVSGLRAGQTACLSGAGPATRVNGVNGVVNLVLPATTADYTLTLATYGKTTTTTLKALGATQLKVKLKKRVEKRSKQKVKVTGLAANEKVTVTVKGKEFSGTADATGVFKTTFKTKGKLAKLGKKKVTVVGEFADRTGKKKFRVTR